MNSSVIRSINLKILSGYSLSPKEKNYIEVLKFIKQQFEKTEICEDIVNRHFKYYINYNKEKYPRVLFDTIETSNDIFISMSLNEELEMKFDMNDRQIKEILEDQISYLLKIDVCKIFFRGFDINCHDLLVSPNIQFKEKLIL